MKNQKKIPVISLFSGAMGLDLGLEQAGFQVVVAVECDRQAVSTIKLNRPELPVIDKKIEAVEVEEILDLAGLKVGGSFIVCGGPSCQTFSTAGHRRSLADPRGTLFSHFVRVVRESQPRFFVMENVRGMLSAAVRHRPLNQRGPGFPPLKKDEELGSAFKHIVEELSTLNYYTVFDLLNAADYGVPQRRERIFFIGGRDGRPVSMPLPTHAAVKSPGRKPWVTLKDAIGNMTANASPGFRLVPKDEAILKLVPPGGNWKDLPTHVQKTALKKAYESWGGRSGFYRRLDWEKPSPALTTQPNSRATMLCHPTELRPLNLSEYAQIQQFPHFWKFGGTVTSQYRQIGNAVPVGLSQAVGRAVLAEWNRHAKPELVGVVQTHNADLVRRMTARPVTILNPPRMRPAAEGVSDLNWKPKKRGFANEYLENAA